MKILLADDDAASRMMLGERLRRLGHEMTYASGGEEAWELLQREYHSILVSDVVMPSGGGIDLCRLVREHDHPRYTYVILLTAYGTKDAYLTGMEAGADDFLTKPCDPDQLAARLRVAERILGLQTRVKQLEGILPICSCCKQIRDESDKWQRLEAYITERTDALFSHGLCPACYEEALKGLPTAP